MARILIVTPVPQGTWQGNRVTAHRWSDLLRGGGHQVDVQGEWNEQDVDLLVALHARKSARSVDRFQSRYPHRPLVLALTGTDLYQDLPESPEAQRSLELASRLVVLQPLAVEHLPAAYRPKARVIFQSVLPPQDPPPPRTDRFEVCVSAHLRPVKDPLRAAEAARLLPETSRIRVVHLGAALTPEMDQQARAEMATNPRYHWLGEVDLNEARRQLASSRLLVVSSLLEGGANVISEAVVCGVPVLATHIPGCRGLLGETYPGYFEVGNTQQLAELLWRAESDPDYYERLRTACLARRPLFTLQREQASWQTLVEELLPPV